MSEAERIISELKTKRNPVNVAGMARFGINPEKALGISIKELRKIGKDIGCNHKIALNLWESEIHEARLLATLIDEPIKVTKRQMDAWTSDFDSWDLCDQCCNNLFRKTDFVNEKIFKWVKSNKEFTRRAGFVLIAVQAVHNKKLADNEIQNYLPLVLEYSTDERNYVKKAVNWALRQIGKRNIILNNQALSVCNQLLGLNSKSAKWIARDAIRELTSDNIITRLTAK
jgi:3-methyladenine DNA glycosylase AlkD